MAICRGFLQRKRLSRKAKKVFSPYFEVVVVTSTTRSAIHSSPLHSNAAFYTLSPHHGQLQKARLLSHTDLKEKQRKKSLSERVMV